MTVVVVAGALANKTGSGGEAWIRTSWVRGFARLGAEAWLVEEIDPAACTDAAGRRCRPADSVQVAYFAEVVERFDLAERALLRGRAGAGRAGDVLFGRAEDAARLAETADLVVNVGGHLDARALAPRATVAYLDIDPGWSQGWLAGDDAARAGHDVFWTIAAHLGRPGCGLPTAGLPWRPVRQPVLLEDWPVTPMPDEARATTVATWRHPFGPPEGMDGAPGKHHEFRRIIDLPRRTPAALELALAIDPGDDGDRDRLAAHGWAVRDARTVAATPDDFRSYVQGSWAELSAAQGAYVHTGSGWFSDRSVRYLASGRPVVVQDTGLAGALPVGEGLLPFDDLDGAAGALSAVAADPTGHSQAARALAERCFAAEVVLAPLLEEAA